MQALAVTNADGANLNIRPKTFQLLQLLVSTAGKPVSKQTLLETVWAESVVSEQVVFQSINEIRQLFADSSVIKTIPKQGYVWVPAVSVTEPAKPSVSKPKSVLAAWGIFAFVLLIALFLFLLSFLDRGSDEPVTGSIVILPTHNQIEGNDHSWVRLGMMDQLIERLPNSQNRGVLRTDYVFEVLRRANAPFKDIKPQHMPQIFEVSGAELIVYSKLTGVPYDYQLSYVFHYRNRLKKGVLLNGKIQSLIDEFSLLIAKQLDDDILPSEQEYQADFNNELLGKAIEKSLEGDYEAVKVLLESIVVSAPQNLTAQRLLAGNLLRLRQFEQSIARVDVALPLAKALNDKQELPRLLYLKALVLSVTAGKAKAGIIAQQAFTLAEQNQDWLLMAHIKNIEANLAAIKGDFSQAEALYHEEKQYHQVLRCPAGEAQSWANLARLAGQQNQTQKYNDAIAKAIDIATTRNLSSQLEYYLQSKSKFNSKHSYK